jgi:uracil-DNA glycosylase family 4
MSLLIDATSLLYKSWHAYDLTTKRGEPTNIIYGTNAILNALLKDLGTTIADTVLFWDLGQSRYRCSRFPNYKNTKNRPASREKPGYSPSAFQDQRVIVQSILTARGFKQVSVAGVEADDLLAIAATTGKHIVVSDDLDNWQLAGNGTSVYAPRKQVWLHDRETCYRQTGLYPEQIPSYKALAGDPSDAVPGVRGLGEKTAKAILAACGSVQELYRRLHTGEPVPVGDKLAKTLLAEEENVKLYYDICQHLTWEMLSAEEQAAFLTAWQTPVEPNRPDEIAAYERWELHEFLKEMPPVDLSTLTAPTVNLTSLTREPAAPPESPQVRRGMPKASQDPMDRLRALGKRVKGCHACTMRAECKLPVPGNVEDASEPPRVMIVGRNPGATEDRQGRGFVGPAGKRLDQLLAGLDSQGRVVHDKLVDRKKSLVTNVLHCYSTGNRAPTEEEWQTCARLFLREEIRILKPGLILSFGAEAMTALTGYDSVMQRAGSIISGKDANGVVQYSILDGGERKWSPVIPDETTIIILPHPAAALRSMQSELKLQLAGRVVATWLAENNLTTATT